MSAFDRAVIGENEELRSELANLRQENSALKQNTTLLNSKICELESGWKADVASLQITLAHLRQENAELKAESLGWRKLAGENGTIADNRIRDLQLHKAALEKCRVILSKARNVSWNYYQGAGHIEIVPDEQELSDALESIKSLTTTPNPQPTQDPATAIAYGLYPSSARPVNPKT